jgi:hypothetical protein
MGEQNLTQGIPSWNFELLVNIFEDDNYWDVSLQEDMPEAYEAISSIGKKYSDIAEYEEALETYNKYEPQIIEYYGGQKAVEFIIDEFDVIPVGIIKPPKLKNKLKAKYIEGINYSIGKYYEPVSAEQQLEWDKGRFDENGNPEGTEIPPITRSLKRALRATAIKKSSATSEVFFHTDIISQIQNGNLNPDSDSSEVEHMSWKEHMAYFDKRHEPHYEKMPDEEIRKLVSGDTSTRPRYSLVEDARSLPMDIVIKKLMIKSGLNPITKEQKDRMSRQELDRLSQYLGPEYIYDKKTMKKLTKKADKIKRKQQKEYDRDYNYHRSNTDRALSNLLTNMSRLGRNIKDDD